MAAFPLGTHFGGVPASQQWYGQFLAGSWNVCRFLRENTAISKLQGEDLQFPSFLVVHLYHVTGTLHQPVRMLLMEEITRKRSSSISSEHPPLGSILHSLRRNNELKKQPHLVRTEQHFHCPRSPQDVRLANMIGGKRGVCSRQSLDDFRKLGNDRVTAYLDCLA